MSAKVLFNLQLIADILGHSVIFNGKAFLVVGGSGGNSNKIMKTESCSLQNDQISCVELESTMNNYIFYPFVMTVDKSFVKNCS